MLWMELCAWTNDLDPLHNVWSTSCWPCPARYSEFVVVNIFAVSIQQKLVTEDTAHPTESETEESTWTCSQESMLLSCRPGARCRQWPGQPQQDRGVAVWRRRAAALDRAAQRVGKVRLNSKRTPHQRSDEGNTATPPEDHWRGSQAVYIRRLQQLSLLSGCKQCKQHVFIYLS